MASKSTPARTIADFRDAHDRDVIVPKKMRAALEQIAKVGPEHYEYEVDFMKLASISTGEIAKYRGQFEAHIVETPAAHGKSVKRVYFGNAKTAAKLRGE